MTADEMRNEFNALYNMMANSTNVKFMHVFGQVHKEMMDWMIANKPTEAQEWLEKLESIKWKNFVTPKEAQKIVDGMTPKAPWTREQWRAAMEKNGLPMEKEPCYNSCALWVVMSMIMSDSSETISKYVEADKLFRFVYDLAVDKLTDKDGVFDARDYFHL